MQLLPVTEQQAEENDRMEQEAATSIQTNIRRVLSQRSFKQTKATMKLQSVFRGFQGRKRSQQQRKQLIIKVMWCTNCDRPEPGGGRCKFCGRKLQTIEKLPHELRMAGMASKTFTFYGFNHCFSRKFTGPSARVPSFVLVDVPYPDQTPIAKRAELQESQEDDDFDPKRYVVEAIAAAQELGTSERSGGQAGPPPPPPAEPNSAFTPGTLQAFLSADPGFVHNKRVSAEQARKFKQRVHAVTKAATNRTTYDSKITIQPWQVLVRAKAVTSNLERMQLWSPHQALLQVWDIAVAFLHVKRFHASAHNNAATVAHAAPAPAPASKRHAKLSRASVGSEHQETRALNPSQPPQGQEEATSASKNTHTKHPITIDCRQVVKLCAGFSWFAAFRTPHAVLRSVSRRILCYADVRNWAVVLQAFEDGVQLFEAGPNALLRLLVELHALFDRAEQTRFFNELFLTDAVCWAEQLAPDTLYAVVRDLRSAIKGFSKNSTGFPLAQLEAEATGNSALVSLLIAKKAPPPAFGCSQDPTLGSPSGGSKAASEKAWAAKYLQLRQLDRAPKKPNF